MVEALAHEMALRFQAGRLIQGPWLDGRLRLARYRRVTEPLLDYFQTWARLTAEGIDFGEPSPGSEVDGG